MRRRRSGGTRAASPTSCSTASSFRSGPGRSCAFCRACAPTGTSACSTTAIRGATTAGCWSACRCRATRCANSSVFSPSSAIRTWTKAAIRRTGCFSVELRLRLLSEVSRRDVSRVAGRRRESLRVVQELEPRRLAAVHAAFGDDEIHRNVVRLRVYRFQESLLVRDPDDARPLGERRERAVEKSAAISQAVSVPVPSHHRQEHMIRADLGRADRVRDAERPFGQLHPGFPFAKNERSLGGDDDRQRGPRPAPPQGRSQMTRVVFVPVRPTKCQYSVHQIRERAFKVMVDPQAQLAQGLLGERFAFPQEPCAFVLAPGGKLGRSHVRRPSSGTKNACSMYSIKGGSKP